MSHRKVPGGTDAQPLIREATKELVDASTSELIERLRESNRTLDNLVSMSFDVSISLDNLIERCSEAICHTLNVQRAGVWMFSDDRQTLFANNIFDYTHMSHAKGTRLDLPDGNEFFKSLKKNDNLSYTNLKRDKRLAPLWEDYFKSNNINALLDTPIKSASGIYGFVCAESSDKDRVWTEDEVTFSTSISGLVALAMESKYLRDAHSRIRQMTQYDELTGLGNRSHFLEKLRTSWDCIKSDMTDLHLYFLSINEFKQINDQYGHDIGDGILSMIGQRLTRICKQYKTATPFRLGGDEYACLVTGLDDDEADFMGRKLSRIISFPYEVQNRKISLNCSVSCARAEKGMNSVNDLMSAADLALDTIKKKKKQSFATYSPELENTALKKKLLEADLMLAVQNIKTEMEIVIQPVVNSKSNRAIGGELLLRWHNRRLGEYIRPDIFIAMAEEQGLIHLIDTYMFSFALQQVKKWSQEFETCPYININISPVTLMGSNVVQSLDKIIADNTELAKLVNLEITEGVEMHNEVEMARIFDDIRKRGPKIYIDDFGSGHTGLSYFTTIPVDAVKVDKSLVERYLNCHKTKVIIKSILDLSKSLNIDTVLEGIETQEEAEILSQFGDHVKLQGYYFGRPMPITQFEANYLNKKLRAKSA